MYLNISVCGTFILCYGNILYNFIYLKTFDLDKLLIGE